jgi:ribosome biogenesis protein BMS1
MQHKELVPLTNRQEAEDCSPPTVIVVMGPKGYFLFNPSIHYSDGILLVGVGKTTLIRSLVKMYTKQNLVDAKGPITVLAGISC